MKKFILSVFVVGSFVLYVLGQKVKLGNDDVNVAVSPNGTMSGQMSTRMMGHKNGQYTGDVADAYYGNVQVQVTISAGKISDVLFLQYPSDRRTSMEINTQAMPYLKQEAILAQSAQVDIVSGATQTSRAFRQSLQSALDKAS